jgi:chromosome segregation protein
VLEFGAGLTSLVGPNGSGKSNLVDAVRWVLGEQNPRVLRAQRMEDLIFSGSTTRRPVSLSEVVAVIDNSDGGLPLDFQEVSVTRRMSRDGLSDYYINRVPVRLKDITDLFSDTGVGREAFSIISQGRIDEVLSARPEDRRGLFEEAAGIVRYRNRKREALRKLEDTEQGRLRLSDIIQEVESQIVPLTEQAERATAHRELESRVAGLEIGRELQRARALETALARKKAEVTGLNERSSRDRARLAQLDNESFDAAAMLGSLEAEVALMDRALADVEASVEKASSQEALAQERLAGLREAAMSVLEAREAARSRRDALSSSLSAQRAAVLEAGRSLAATRQAVAAAQDSLTLVETTWREVFGGLEARRLVLVEHQKAASEQQKRAFGEALAAKAAFLGAERLRAEHTAVKAQAGSLDAETERDRNEVSAARTEIENIATETRDLDSRMKLSAADLAGISASVLAARRKMAASSARASALRDMKVRFDGYSEGPRKALLAATAGRIPGVLGSVAEVLAVKEGYERAIDAALGSSAQFIVTESAKDAEAAIAFLKTTQSGRATFLPLDTIRQFSLSAKETQSIERTKAAVTAASVVTCQDQFLPVVANLIGRCAVVPELKAAVALGRDVGFSFRIATLDGDLVNPGGSMTGGDQRQARPGLFAREADLQKLESETSELSVDLDRLEKAAREAESFLREVETEKDNLEDRRRMLEGECSRKTARLEEIGRATETIRTQAQSLEKRMEALLGEADARADEAREAGKNAQEALSRCAGLESEAVRASASAEQADVERGIAHSRLTEVREALARAEQVEISAGERLLEMEAGAAEASRVLEEKAREELGTADAVRAAESAFSAAQSDHASARAGRDRAREASLGKRQARDSQSAAVTSLERSLRMVSKSLDSITLKLVEATSEETRLSTSLLGLEENLKARFGMGLAEAKATYPALDESVEPLIAELKQEILALLPVNASAPEDLSRAKERVTFLKAQDEDLAKARSSLAEIIDEMDAKMKELFKSSFAQIRENFKQVFRKLFGGGEADIWLVDPSNALESGVEISARPPGRSTQLLSLLSGGERCLAAIALLFAMQDLRPSPFCVLDEIEASLDEANVEKFCVYLKGLADQNQYILVTHQKRTMEVSDVLYGLTMQEMGVSNILSVKLAEVFQT